MNRCLLISGLFAVVVLVAGSQAVAQEKGQGEPMIAANQQRQIIDDMEDISAWHSGSPAETTISASTAHVKQGKSALKFANVVDHTQGEKNYPVGWPRIEKDLAKMKLTDWSDYDFFECWIYAETSRETLPSLALSLNFSHTKPKRSTSVPLKQVKKDAWVKIVIPIAELENADDVRRVQLNISEANYRHGDRVDFYLDDMLLTRLVQPAIAELVLERKVLYADDPGVTARYRLLGHQGMDDLTAELQLGRDAAGIAKSAVKVTRTGELTLPLPRGVTPGDYWGRLSLRDQQGKVIDQKQAEFRVVQGPF